MSPDTRLSLLASVQAFADKAGAAVKEVKAIPLDDPLAKAKIQASLTALRTGASNLCDISCAAQCIDDDTDSGPVTVTVGGNGPIRMYG